jgi:hypothetical protein
MQRKHRGTEFLSILIFCKYYFRNEFVETFFLNVAFLNRVNPSDVNCEGVTSVYLTRLKGLALYQSRQLFGATQFPEYIASLFLFLPAYFLSFYILSPPRGGSIGDFYFSPQILSRGALNQLHELIFQLCWVRTSSSPSHFLVF